MLAVGQWVAWHAESIDLAWLSAALGREVQLFVSDRVADRHRWERGRLRKGPARVDDASVTRPCRCTDWHSTYHEGDKSF